MAKIIPLQAREHRELQSLLGWYAAGALDEGDRLKIERHLPGCARCREELAEESRLQLKLESVPLEVEHDWSKLRARIDGARSRPAAGLSLAGARRWIASPARPAPARSALVRPALVRPALVRPAWGWLLAAQVLLVVTVGAAALTWSQPRYHALSAPSLLPTGNVIVMFRPDTREKDLRDALRGGGARLVDGPTATGVYVLRVAPDARSAVIAALRRRPGVTLAEPIDAGGPP